MIEFLSKFEYHEFIYGNILWIFSNICASPVNAKQIFEKTSFYEIVHERFVKRPIFDNELKQTFIWLYGILLKNELPLHNV